MILAMILVIVIVAGIVLYISSREQPVPAQPVEIVPEPAVEQGLRILKNYVIENERELEQRSNEFFVDDEVILYTHAEGFENVFVDGLYDYWLQYGMLVFDSDDNMLQGLSNPFLFEAVDTVEGPTYAYKFTAKLSTLNLPAGEYTLRSIVTDGLTNETARSDYTINLVNPETVRISGPFFGVLQSTGGFDVEKPEYHIGDEIHTLIQVRGFDYEGMSADVGLSVLFYDHETGTRDLELSSIGFYDFKELETPDFDAFNLEVNLVTDHLEPGYYWIEFIAKDRMSGEVHKANKFVNILEAER